MVDPDADVLRVLGAAASDEAADAGVVDDASRVDDGALWARIEASVSRPGRFGAFVDLAARQLGESLDEVQALFARSEDASQWVAGPFPGSHVVVLDASGPIRGLIKLDAGIRVPVHGHGGVESVLILEGGYDEDDRRRWEPGEEHVMGPRSEHKLHVPEEHDCYATFVLAGDLLPR